MKRIGIAGFGKIGKLRKEILQKRNDVNIVAIYDIKKPKYLEKNIKFCSTYEELISSDLDAIFICTYNNVIAEYTIIALKNNIDIFCEKPPATNLKQLKKVINQYKKSKSILKYGFNHRYHYSVIEAKKIIESGKMGKLLWLRGVYGKAGSIDYDKNWRNYKKYSGGGILMDQGIHMLDLIIYLSKSEFNEVSSFVTTSYWNVESEDNAFAIMKSKENIVAFLHSSATQWRHKFLLELCFEDGYINLDGILSSTRSYSPEKLIVGRREFEDITFAMGKPKESITDFENDDSWELEIDEFINAINGKGQINEGTVYDAYTTLELVEKIYKKSAF